MNQNGQPTLTPYSTISESTLPDLSLCLNVRSYPAQPSPLNAGERATEEGDILDIRAIRIGPSGSRMVKLLSRNLAGVTCHEVLRGVDQESSGDMAALFSAVERLTPRGVNISMRVEFSPQYTVQATSPWRILTASRIIHEQVSPTAKIVAGLISDENLGGFVKLTVLTVQ